MKARTLVQAFALLFLASACNTPGICKVGKTGAETSDCPTPHTFCYGGEKPQEGSKGICVYGELSPEGKPVAKITTWRLLLHHKTEVAPSKWDKRDVANGASVQNPHAPWVGMAEARVEVEVVGASLHENLKVWTGHGVPASCSPPAERKPQGETWTCSFKEGWAASLVATETVEVKAQVGEAEAREREYRVLCSRDLGLRTNPPNLPLVSLPLAMSGKHLLLGTHVGDTPEIPEANDSLYVFDTDTCALHGKGLHTGTLQGPMVVLGNTGRVAVALNNGPPGKEGQRLSLVNVSWAEPGFVGAEDCSQEVGNQVVFEHGLSLLSLSDTSRSVPWRLMAPANHPEFNRTRVVAYTPDSILASGRCVYSNPIEYPLQIPLSQLADGGVVGVYSSPSKTFYQPWRFNETGWREFAYKGIDLTGEVPLWDPVFPLALMEDTFWVPGSSPAAVDSQGRTYYTVRPPDENDFHLRLQSDNIFDGVSSSPFDGAPVGSPLLGEPLVGREPQVYLVTITGKVLAYGTELGEPLWVHNLGIDIAPTAQPVLSGDTLWVVGARGEIRGIRVSSDGLNRTAYWPKTFRDNCNTSSRLSNPTDMPSCFQ